MIRSSPHSRFLVHWVGDIHQPLHVSFEDDRGGNEIRVSGECTGKLHSTWDICLVQIGVGESVVAAATDLVKSITPAKRNAGYMPRHSSGLTSPLQSPRAPRRNIVFGRENSCEAPPSDSVTIDQSYIDANVPFIREQLQKAGVRLAHLLDAVLRKGAVAERD